MLEKEVEKVLVQEVKKLGGAALKWVSPGNAGVPDRIVIFPGQAPVFVEVKSDTGNLSALQEAQIRRLLSLGQRVEVVRGVEGLMIFFAEYGHADTAVRVAKRFKEVCPDGI